MQLTSCEKTQDSVECVLREIKRRVIARLELCTEIRQLECGNLPVFTTNNNDLLPQKLNAILQIFSTISWSNYCNSVNPIFQEQGLVSSLDIFYEAILRRGNSMIL